MSIIRIEATVCRPGSGEATVEDWCRAQSMPPGYAAALVKNGANQYRYAPTECLEELAGSAIDQLLRQAAVRPSCIDVLIVYNTSQCNVLPMPQTLAGRLRAELGLSRATTFSIAQQQCVSPIHALRVLDALFILHPEWQHAIVAGADKILREDVRAIGTSGIHSDAGAAVLVSRGSQGGISGLYTYNDPRVASGFMPDGSYEPNSNYLWTLISAVQKIARLAGIRPADLTTILPHNVNRRAWHRVLDILRIPRERLFAENFHAKGHAFGSDIAMNIADSNALSRAGRHLVLISGIGGCFGGFIVNTEACA